MKHPRTICVLSALLLAAACFPGCLWTPAGPPTYRPAPPPPASYPDAPPGGGPLRELFHLVNRARVRAGAPLLRPAADLMQSARIRACELPRRFSHRRPDGRFFDTVLRYRGRRWTENIAAGSETPEGVMDQWMNSPGHRQNMLDPRLREVGLGLCVVKDEYGHYWVQLFRR